MSNRQIQIKTGKDVVVKELAGFFGKGVIG